MRVAVINAGMSDASSTARLAEQLATATAARLGADATTQWIDLRPLAVDIAQALVSGLPGERVRAAIDVLANADGVIAAAPIYQAGPSGLFKSFLDLLDTDLLVATPVALVATAGTARHSLVPDQQMRPLFAYLRAMTAPTALFAAPEDWGGGLDERVERTASELASLITGRLRELVRDDSWSSYQHTFGGQSDRAARSAGDITLDTDLMRLAAGGT